MPDIKLNGTIDIVAERKQTNNTAALSAATAGSTTSTEGYEIKLNYNKPNNLELKRDMSCNIEIIVAEKKNVLAVPLAAIKWDNNQPYVNIKNGENTEKKSIIIGFEGDEYVEIASGLKSGDKIILFSSADIAKTGGLFK